MEELVLGKDYRQVGVIIPGSGENSLNYRVWIEDAKKQGYRVLVKNTMCLLFKKSKEY